MENLGIKKFYQDKKILITGHTGFKGSWMVAMLSNFSKEIYGISKKDFLYEFNYKYIKKNLTKEFFIDLSSEKKKLENTLKKIKPDIIFHFAAESIVSEGYKDPFKTWKNNFVSTINLIEVSNMIKSVKLMMITTTDKVYKNYGEKKKYFKETDILDGNDPYSKSKVAIENFIQDLNQNKLNFKIVIGRAGNVIGGGDWAKNRIIPDIIRSIKNRKKLTIRNIKSTRPWQHVLDCLLAYLLIVKKLNDKKIKNLSYWNIGPKKNQKPISVNLLLNMFKKKFRSIVFNNHRNNFFEPKFLGVDSSKIKKVLNWENFYTQEQSIFKTIQWYEEYLYKKKIITSGQIKNYLVNFK